jgi:RsiW-degrading membrane proteinase PrsW (M82 family)
VEAGGYHPAILVAIGAAPAIIAMLVVDFLDRKRPEPRGLRWKVTAAGVASVIPVLAVDQAILGAARDWAEPIYTYNGALFISFVIAGAVEEFFKIGAIYWIVWRRPEFDERMDGIVYGARAGLGFALLENCFYLLKTTSQDQAIQVGILRAVLAVPGHALWSAMIGYFAARRRFDRRGLGFLGGLALAVLAHGGYDYVIFARVPLDLEGQDAVANYILVAPVLVILASYLIVKVMARRALALDDADAAAAARLSPPPAPPAQPAP